MKFFLALILVLISISTIQAVGGEKKDLVFSPEQDPIDKMVYNEIINYTSRQNQVLVFDRVLKCTTKVVSGKMYYMNILFKNHSGEDIEYFAAIYVIPWEKSVEVQEFKRVNGAPYEKLQEKGGNNSFDWYESTNDENFEKAKKEVSALIKKTLLAKKMSPNFLVLKAATQVVAGMNYKLVIAVQDKKFDVEIYSRPWEQQMEVTKFEPLPQKLEESEIFRTQKIDKKQHFENMRGDVGTESNIDFYSEPQEIQDIVLPALRKESEFSNGTFNIVSTSKQVVSGIKYNFVIEANNQQYAISAIVQIWKKSVVLSDIRSLN